MTDIDHKALADAIRADRKAGVWQHGKDILGKARHVAQLESAYLQLADERQSLLDRVKELELRAEVLAYDFSYVPEPPK